MSGAISECYTRLPVGSAILVWGGGRATDGLSHRVTLSVLVLGVLCASHSLSYTQGQPASISHLYFCLWFWSPGSQAAVSGGGVAAPKLPVISPPTQVNPEGHRVTRPMGTSPAVFQERPRGCALFP